jgi:hypothetical protein
VKEKFTVDFLNNAGEFFAVAGVLCRPVRWSASVMGGPKDAEIAVTGSQESLMGLFHLLHRGVMIRNRMHAPVWWGEVHEVRATFGALTVGLSLDAVRNRVAVRWSDGNRNGVTAWQQDDLSVAEFGLRELIESRGQMGRRAAEVLRGALLRDLAAPIGESGTSGGGGQTTAKHEATLYCRGWWQSLGLRYYQQAVGYVTHPINPAAEAILGDGETQMVAQPFLTGSQGWVAGEVSLYLARVGDPQDSVRISLYSSDGGGVPAFRLDSVVLDATEVPTNRQKVQVSLMGSVFLNVGETYYLCVEREGPEDADNYFVVGMDESNSHRPALILTMGGGLSNAPVAWLPRTPAAMMAFEVWGHGETTAQIGDVWAACGQFLTGLDVRVGSGIWTAMYRAGEFDGLTEMTDLLATGTADSQKLLATVTVERVLRVDVLAVSGDEDLLLGADGRLRWPTGGAIGPGVIPVGQWVRLATLPTTLSNLMRISPFLLTEAECDDAGRLRWDGAGVRGLWKVGDVLQG